MSASTSSILISQQDHDRLTELLRLGSFMSTPQLAAKLSAARIVLSTQIPADVVTMNSVIELTNITTNETLIVGLVYPLRAQGHTDRVSILTPEGVELLGTRIGQVVQWTAPHGTVSLKVKGLLFQPEAVGAWNL